jgi:threonine dehydrogenase-like Zn-dependent dehydrogenase
MVKPTHMDNVAICVVGSFGLAFNRVLMMYVAHTFIVTTVGKNRVEKTKKCGNNIVVAIAGETLGVQLARSALIR